jgi:hypothetical protein
VIQLFSVLFTEPVSANDIRSNAVTDYNSALSYVMLGGVAHTQARRFIVVRNRKAFCYAVWVVFKCSLLLKLI